MPLPFHEPQQTSVFAAHETFAPPAPVPQAIVPVGAGGGGGGGVPASFVPPEVEPLLPLLELLEVLPLEEPPLLLARPLDPPEEVDVPVPSSVVGSVPNSEESGGEKSSVLLAPLQAARTNIEAEDANTKRSFIRPQD